MRGKGFPYIITSTGSRITPAYAGKSAQISRFFFVQRDHPRLCGEKQCLYNFLTIFQGSPPPMRGKVQRTLQAGLHDGITPAYAGKSIGAVLVIMLKQNHPRLCGEKSMPLQQRMVYQGSPPPMRGKEIVYCGCYIVSRITPAYAGKRTIFQQGQKISGDHPRLCGEKNAYEGNAIVGIRITPAYAGKSLL